MEIFFQFVQTLYWASLSTWFGSSVFVALAAPIIFRTVHDSDPTLPRVLSVNLDHQHSTLLAGEIVGNLLRMLTRVGLTCAVVVLCGLIAQIVLLPGTTSNHIRSALRGALFVAAVVITIYDWRVLSPKLNDARTKYIQHADEVDLANSLKDQFDRYHQESVSLLFALNLVLLGMILFSANQGSTFFFSAD